MADGNIFISYRRGADSSAAGRLYDRLERNFRSEQLFFDMDSIPLGVDFAEHIDAEVAKCDVQLVVIGPGWLEEIARLSDPEDFVRIEIESALKRPDIPVVPVLLEGAEMPGSGDLPESLRPLVRRNAIVLGHAHFAQVVDGRLTEALQAILGTETTQVRNSEKRGPQAVRPPPRPRRRALWIGAGTFGLLAILAVGAIYYAQPSFRVEVSGSSSGQSAVSVSGSEATSRQAPSAVEDTDTDGAEDTDTEVSVSADGSCAGSTRRDSDLSKLHPALRDKVRLVQADLEAEAIPFEVFEAYRSPARQESLWAQGRTKPGNKVTWVGPWHSLRQFGLAVNFVLRIDGKWSWDNQGKEAEYWERLNELGEKHGLTPLYNSKGSLIEAGYLQLQGASASEIYDSGFPEGGDRSWADNLKDAITTDRKCLTSSERSKLLGHVMASSVNGIDDTQFRKLHAFVRSAEGSLSVTQSMLANWRGEDVTSEDLRNLSPTEADAIFKINYYDACRCGEMPERTAMAVYYAAVMHGPKRAIEFLQTALQRLQVTVDGKPVEVDGIIGRPTLVAAQQADPTALSNAVLDLQEEYLRGLDAFKTFGRGWLNRLENLREFLHTLPENGGFWTTDIRLDGSTPPDQNAKD